MPDKTSDSVYIYLKKAAEKNRVTDLEKTPKLITSSRSLFLFSWGKKALNQKGRLPMRKVGNSLERKLYIISEPKVPGNTKFLSLHGINLDFVEFPINQNPPLFNFSAGFVSFTLLSSSLR